MSYMARPSTRTAASLNHQLRAPNNRPGVLLLDVLVGLAVFSIIVTGVIYAMLFSQQGLLKSGDRVRAVFLNQKAVSAARAVRDSDFASLTEGTFGVTLNSGVWELSGTGVTTSDGYTTAVTISSLSADRYLVTAKTDWSFGPSSTGSSTLVSELTDWHRVQNVGNWSNSSLDGAYVDDGTPLFNSAVANSTYAFVTSETSDGGDGLYVFDISDTSDPQRRAAGFNLGHPGYDSELVEDHLYVITGDSAQEVRIYNVSDPPNLSAGNLVASINVPGNGNARSLAYYDDVLYVVSREDASESEVFTYDVSNLSSITALDDINDPGSSFSDVRLRDGYAYLASSIDTMELRVLDVFDPQNLQFAPGGGYNLPDTTDGVAVVTVGDYVILGRMQGGVTEELHLFDISESPVPPSAPQNAETGENVTALDADPTATYGFASTEHDNQELIILDIADFAAGQNPITDTYNTTTGFGRGVKYSILHDRVLFLTNTAFIILKPA